MNKRRNKLKLICLLPVLLSSIAFLSSCSNKSNKEFNSIQEIVDGSYVIGTPLLTFCEEQAPEIFPNAKEYRSYGSLEACYLALQQEKVDALIMDESQARIDVKKGVNGVKILDGKVGIGNKICVGIGDTDLVNENSINSILNELTNNGTLDDMRARWVNAGNYDMPEIDVPTNSEITLKVATSGIVEPFSFYKNGELTGFDIEISRMIAKSLNYNLAFEVNSNYTSLISSTQSGKSDLLIANLYETSERKEQIALSIPYFITNGVVLVKDHSALKGYTSLEELKYKKIGYTVSSSVFEYYVKTILPDSEQLTFDSSPDCVTALLNNRIDALVTDLPYAKYCQEVEEGVSILPEYLGYEDYAFCLKKNSSLTEEFDAVLKDFKDRNILTELREKWFSGDTNSAPSLYTQDPNKTYKRTIKAVSSCALPPMCYLRANGENAGYEADLILMMCDALDYKVEFVNVGNFAAILSYIESGKADIGYDCVAISDERKQTMDLTFPIYEGATVLLVKNAEIIELSFFEKLKRSFEKTFVVEERWKMILSGLLVTLIISVCAGLVGLLLGFGLCMIKRNKNKPLNAIVKGVCKVIQGTPIVVLLMIFYYVIFGKIDINAIIVAICAFGINFGVYSSEIMYSGFVSLDKGQEEAALAMGYSKRQTFWKISFPQAAKKFLPVLRGEFISMLKMTSVAGYISVAELTRVGDIIRSRTMEAFFPLIVIALIYFALSELLTLGLTVLEKKLDSRNRPFKLKGVEKHE